MLIIFCFLCGIVLSFRFKFAILFPGTLLAWIFSIAGGLLAGTSSSLIAIDMIASATGLQIGYLAGTLLMAGVMTARQGLRSGWSKKAVPLPESAVQ